MITKTSIKFLIILICTIALVLMIMLLIMPLSSNTGANAPSCTVTNIDQVVLEPNPDVTCTETTTTINNNNEVVLSFDETNALCNWEYTFVIGTDDFTEHKIQAKPVPGLPRTDNIPAFRYNSICEESGNCESFSELKIDTQFSNGIHRIGPIDYYDGGDEYPVDGVTTGCNENKTNSAVSPKGCSDGSVFIDVTVENCCEPEPIPPDSAPYNLFPGTNVEEVNEGNITKIEPSDQDNLSLNWEKNSEWGKICGDEDKKMGVYFRRNEDLDEAISNCEIDEIPDNNDWFQLGEDIAEDPNEDEYSTSIDLSGDLDGVYCWAVLAENSDQQILSEVKVFEIGSNEPYIMTHKGDVFVEGSVTQTLTDGLDLADSLPNTIEINSGSVRISNELNNLFNITPYFSSNLYQTNGTNFSRSSNIKSIIGNNSSMTDFYDNNLYEYYESRLDYPETDQAETPSGDKIDEVLSIPDGSNIVKVNPSANASVVNISTSSNQVVCNEQYIILIDGDLRINNNILNQDNQSSCIFIVKGTIQLQINDFNATQYGNNTNIIEGMFIGQNFDTENNSTTRKVVINGSIITYGDDGDDENASNNNHSIKTDDLAAPQETYIYDPRHLLLWDDILQGQLTSSQIREERYLELIN